MCENNFVMLFDKFKFFGKDELYGPRAKHCHKLALMHPNGSMGKTFCVDHSVLKFRSNIGVYVILHWASLK